jgi:hypothetical protein
MEGPLEQVLEHPKSPDFIDAATSAFTYDSLAGLDYLQYPHTEAFGMSSINRTSLSILHSVILLLTTLYITLSLSPSGLPYPQPCRSYGRVHLWQLV